MDKKKDTKSPRLGEIKKFLTQNIKKLSIPFLKTPLKAVDTAVNAISPLPKTEKPRQRVEEQTKPIKTEEKTTVNPLQFTPTTTKLNIVPLSIMSKLGKTNETPMLKLAKPEIKNVLTPILAKLEPKATKAGGSDGAKITLLGGKNPTAPKEAALVGEDGPEKIVHATGTVIPFSKMEKIAENKQPQKTKPVEQQKTVQSKPVVSALEKPKQNIPAVFSQFNKIVSGVGVTALPKIAPKIQKMISSAFPMSTILSKTEIKAKEPATVKPKATESLVNLSPQDKRQLLVMAQTNQITNKIVKDKDGKPVLNLPAYAQGRNMENVEPQAIKQNQITPQDNIKPVETKLEQTSPVEAQKTNPLPSVEPVKNQNLAKQLESPKPPTPAGNEPPQQSNDQPMQDGGQPAMINMNMNGRSASPTTINTITYEYDIFRKTSDYVSMLPEWRIRLG
jgi:hypothetical protein